MAPRRPRAAVNVNVPRPVAVRRDRQRRKRAIPHRELLPPTPKRATTGYIFFMKSLITDQVDGQRMSGPDVLRAAGAQWRVLSAERKAVFNGQAVEDQERYQQEIAVWKARKAELKRPGTPYCQFVKAVWDREGAQNRTLTQMGCHCAERWRKLNPEERKVYGDRYEDLQQAYNERIQVLLAEHRNAAADATNAAADAANAQDDEEADDSDEDHDDEEDVDDEEEYEEE